VNLRSRLNRRLVKLAKWADSSSEDRHGEFRNNPQHNYPYRSLIKPMIYSKPIPVAEINAVKTVAAPVTASSVKSENIVAPVVQPTIGSGEAVVNEAVPVSTIDTISEQKTDDVVQE